MKLVKLTFFVAMICLITGCGEQTLDMRADSNSIDEITKRMSIQEQADFLRDAELLAALKGGMDKLHGYTLKRLREEAALGRKFVREQNAKFLAPLVAEMEASGRNSVSLQVNRAGIFSSPKEGYIPKTFSINQLRSILNSEPSAHTNLDGAKVADKTISSQQNEHRNSLPPSMGQEQSPRETQSKQLTPEQFFKEAAKNASDEYAARWDAIQNDPQAFFNKCVNEEVSIAVKLGGAPEEETKKRAKIACNMKLANLKSCMDKPAAKPAHCFADVLETGD